MTAITNEKRRAFHAHVHGKWDMGTHFFRIKHEFKKNNVMDFLSERAADSIIWVLADELNTMYESEEWYPVMGNLWHRIDAHPLAGVMLKSWRRHVVDLVIEHYNELAKELADSE